jgi:hypothetical protein
MSSGRGPHRTSRSRVAAEGGLEQLGLGEQRVRVEGGHGPDDEVEVRVLRDVRGSSGGGHGAVS